MISISVKKTSFFCIKLWKGGIGLEKEDSNMKKMRIISIIAVTLLILVVVAGWASWHWKPELRVHPPTIIGEASGEALFTISYGQDAIKQRRKFTGRVLRPPKMWWNDRYILLEIDLLENFSLEEVDQDDRIEETQ